MQVGVRRLTAIVDVGTRFTNLLECSHMTYSFTLDDDFSSLTVPTPPCEELHDIKCIRQRRHVCAVYTCVLESLSL